MQCSQTFHVVLAVRNVAPVAYGKGRVDCRSGDGVRSGEVGGLYNIIYLGLIVPAQLPLLELPPQRTPPYLLRRSQYSF